MKILLPVAALLINALALPAQITLEHTYPDAGYHHSVDHDQFFLWNFEASGTKYVKIDRTAFMITLYNLDHTVYKNISYAAAPVTGSMAVVFYLSEHLFDLDDGVEYMYSSYGGAPGTLFTRVYDEDGSVLLNADTCSLFVFSTVHQQQFPIMNTPEGTKLIVSDLTHQSARVYRLPGTLACFTCDGSITTGMNGDTQGAGPDAPFLYSYPNPVQENVGVEYQLPPGTEKGELVFTDANGREVLRRIVHANADNTVVSVSMLAAGTYFYHLRTEQGILQGPKLLVIK